MKNSTFTERCIGALTFFKFFTYFTNFSRLSHIVPEAATGGATLLKEETLVQVFSREFCEISKNTFFQNTFGRLLL